MYVTSHERKIAAIVSSLLEWYARNARDLPWRRTRDPYAIWISEAMLQQTQVATVIPYWERWMRAFPDVRALAAAPPEKVLKLWEGLGYYARARNLHRAAQLLVQASDARMPGDVSGWLALPGIGRYTAGAICSIAFNQPVPILDGNVTRVLCRILGIRTDPRDKETNRLLWERAAELVETAHRLGSSRVPRCSHLNQSLMELGALVCTPRQPQCSRCPVQSVCVAFCSGLTESIPQARVRVKTIQKIRICWLIEHRGRVLAVQRPGRGVNAHLWEFPTLETNGDTLDKALAIAEKICGARPDNGHRAGMIRHSITNHRYIMQVYRGRIAQRPPVKDSALKWLTLAQIRRYPFAAAHRKASKWLEL